MLYHILSPVHEFFGYITVRVGGAVISSFLLLIIFGPRMIAWMQKKQIGQSIRDDGPKSHEVKAGTPTMGGVLIILAITFGSLLFVNLTSKLFWACYAVVILYGAVG